MKAIEINVSDVAAMGARPKYALISLALPKTLDISFEKVFILKRNCMMECGRHAINILWKLLGET